MPKFLVTGVGGPAGRSLAVLLQERHCTYVGADSRPLEPDSFPFFRVPMARDDNFILTIQTIVRAEQVNWIIPTVSEELPVFSASWTDSITSVLIGTAGAVACANDKYLTAQILQQAGVSVPRFALPSQVGSARELTERIGWPCISKPRIGRGGREVTLNEDGNFSSIAALSDAYILQEFASGTDYAPELFIHPDRKTHVVAVIEKTELKEGKVGNATAVRRVDAPDVAETALAAALAMGLSGPLDIDIRRRTDGVPVVLEINARFGANSRSAPEILDAALAYMRS